MSTVSVTQINPDDEITSAGANLPHNQLANAINGNLDDTNISSLSGTKIIPATLPATAFDVATAGGWHPMAGNITGVTYNGNRSYDLTTSVDNTTSISPGMRLRTTRTGAAPTQSASLNGSNQYFSKSSPAGMTFTDDFVVSAWVKLSSFPPGQIASRYNGSNGWMFLVTATGQVRLQGFNGSSSNTSYLETIQSLPLNKWVHLTAQLDMSTYTATSTTSYAMFDGVDVPVVLNRAGTNPTSLVQAGNLEIGACNGGVAGSFFPGKIVQVAIFNAKVTQATMRGYISQGLSGTETSLTSAYSLSNSVNDLNANANNLTAQGAATTTNADSPFGQQADGTISSTINYGIIQAITSATITVQVPEGCTLPTTGGISAVSYSNAKAPYGFTTQTDKWNIYTKSLVNNTASSPTANVWYGTASGTPVITVPIGKWLLKYECALSAANGATSGVAYSTLSTSASTETIREFTAGVFVGAANVQHISNVYREYAQSTPALTPYYHLFKTDTGISSIAVRSDVSPLVMIAENGYL